MEFVDSMIDVSEIRRLQNLRNRILSREAMHAADMKDAKAEGIEEGEAKGRAEGKNQAKREFAQKLIADGFKYDKIAQLTGLSVGEVKELSLARAANS